MNMNTKAVIGEDWLYDRERDFGDLYCSTVKQLRLLGRGSNLTALANECELSAETVRKFYRGEYSNPSVTHIEIINKLLNKGVLTIYGQPVVAKL